MVSLNDRGLATYAASVAFYMFLSVFPMAALAASLMPCVGISETAMLHLMDGIVPSEAALLFRTILSNVYRNVFPALPVSLLLLLWSSAQAFSELLKGMAAMTGDRASSYFKRRLRAILLTIAMLMTLPLSLAVLIFGVRIAVLVQQIYPQASGLLQLILRLRYLVMAVFLWLLFVFVYKSIPNQRFSFHDVGMSAALASLIWIFFSILFSLYAARVLDLTLYGSLTTLVLTMLWMYYCQHILLIGAGICAWKHKKKEAVKV